MVTTPLQVAHMTKSEMSISDMSLLGPCILILNQYFNTRIDEYYILWISMVSVVVSVVGVVGRIVDVVVICVDSVQM